MWIMVTQLIAIRPSPDNDGGHDWSVVAMVWSKAQSARKQNTERPAMNMAPPSLDGTVGVVFMSGNHKITRFNIVGAQQNPLHAGYGLNCILVEYNFDLHTHTLCVN